MNFKSIITLVCGVLFSIVVSGQVDNIPCKIIKHAHNDYKHKNPLIDALNENFGSVEADVFLIGDSLFVAHDKHEIKAGNTLRELYLNPLKKRIQQNKGSVYGDGEELILFVDIKADGKKVYKKLHKILINYAEIMSTSGKNGFSKKAIRVVVSGDRPIEYMKKQSVRYAGVDGRLENLNGEYSSDLMPIVSDSWNKCFKWNGEGEMPANEKKVVNELVQKAHENGYLLRFWGTPNKSKKQRLAFWKLFADARVDLIGTDHLEELNTFISEL